jgi:hypothetical protein
VLEEQPSGAPRLVLADEATGYASITDAHADLVYRLSLPDEHGGFFVVVSSASAWCESSWRSMQTRVLAPGASTEAPRPILAERGNVFLGEGELFALATGRDDFEVRHTSRAMWLWGDDGFRTHVHHYARRSAGFERVQPIVEKALDLPGEWSSMPWELARRFVAAADPESLRSWHDRLERGNRKDLGHIAVESTDEATGRTRLAVTCAAKCAALPPRLFIDVQKDGDGWAMGAVTVAP